MKGVDAAGVADGVLVLVSGVCEVAQQPRSLQRTGTGGLRGKELLMREVATGEQCVCGSPRKQKSGMEFSQTKDSSSPFLSSVGANPA